MSKEYEMKAEWRSARAILLLFGVALSCAVNLWAADAVRGMVTDEAGKPVRGALVRVAIDKMTINRFSQKDGRFEITVPSGSYYVTVDAYGFAMNRKMVDMAK